MLFPNGIKLQNCLHGECALPSDASSDEITTQVLAVGDIAAIVVSSFIILSTFAVWLYYKLEQRKLRRRVVPPSRVGLHIKFKDIGYSVNKKPILKRVSGEATPGSLLAIMGPSGSGKTTLLEILSQKSKEGKLSGEVLINERKVSKSKKSEYGYIDQEDLFLDTLTVFETILFSANTRLPESMSLGEKKRRVLDVISVLGLSHVTNSRIGGLNGRGLSGGEKRRVSVGIELVTDPAILFLDEPTSGLDSYNAHLLVQTLKKLAGSGKTVVCTIHQPRSDIFAMFDNVLALSRGEFIYFGPQSKMNTWMNETGRPCPQGYNIADHLIDLAISYESEKQASSDFSPPEIATTGNLRKITPVSYDVLNKPASTENASQWYTVSSLTRLNTVMERSGKVLIRKPSLLIAHLGISICLGCFIGGLYWKSPNTLGGLQNKLGSAFFILALIGFSSLSAIGVGFLSIKQVIKYLTELSRGIQVICARKIQSILWSIPIYHFKDFVRRHSSSYPSICDPRNYCIFHDWV